MLRILKGWPGKPSHPPLTDVSIGAYTVGVAMLTAGALGLQTPQMAVGALIAISGGLVLAAPTAITGLLDWLDIPKGTPTRTVATLHLVTMVAATVLFALAWLAQRPGYVDEEVRTLGLVLGLVAEGILVLGGFIGGAIVFVYGNRVLKQPGVAIADAIIPGRMAVTDSLRVGIIGSGHIGGTLAWHFVGHGHAVAVSNSRGPETLRDLVAELGEGARAMTAEEAADFGDVVVVSVPFGHYRDIPTDGMTGKVVIDTNNYYPDRDGHFERLDDDSTTSSEMLAERLPGRVVKAFNAIRWDHLRDMGQPETAASDRVGIPISADDAEAKRIVAGLIEEIGFTAVDAGSLAEGGRKHQPGTPVYTADLQAGKLRARIAL